MKIAVLASGSGTILASMIEHKVPISLVLADKQCKALEIAQAAGIPAVLIDRREFGYKPKIGEGWDREGFTRAVAAALQENGIKLVAMAGFFTILHDVIFEDYDKRILNIHPALLPAFKGEYAVRDALAARVSETGSTVHIATEVLDDESYILGQVRVPVEDGDDVETLWERIKVQERELYPQVLLDILSGKINLDEVVKNSAR
ncbi:MAG TPA: formyltransferase family protein [Candidatus Saccharimonadales bacterium]|nr:formyltransferase family protein [Candidatus Saccharimonadales bacterium]